jgi:glycosyltransferase involved in cell wall biosynthesis
MLLSIVIPIYNEEHTLAELVGRVLAVPLDLERELVLVDDASKDASAQVAERLIAEYPDKQLRLIRHPRNRGKGAAVRTGFAQARGNVVLIQDADLEYDPRDYPRLLKPILEGQADVVFGSRFVGSEAHRVLFFWHMLANKFLTTVSNALTNLNLTDMEVCYKVLRREVIESLHLVSEGFAIEPEITAKVAKGRWRIYEVGISYAGRSYAEGKKITWRDGVRALGAIIRFSLFG